MDTDTCPIGHRCAAPLWAGFLRPIGRRATWIVENQASRTDSLQSRQTCREFGGKGLDCHEARVLEYSKRADEMLVPDLERRQAARLLGLRMLDAAHPRARSRRSRASAGEQRPTGP